MRIVQFRNKHKNDGDAIRLGLQLPANVAITDKVDGGDIIELTEAILGKTADVQTSIDLIKCWDQAKEKLKRFGYIYVVSVYFHTLQNI